MSQDFLICLVVGIGLMLAEFVLPGFISLFLGMAGVLVAGLVWAGVLEGWPQIGMAWVIITILLVLTLRSTFKRIFEGDRSIGSMDEDGDAKGTIVEVVKDVSAEHDGGQVNFRDAVWSARAVKGVIPRGAKARLVSRQNLVWLVESVH